MMNVFKQMWQVCKTWFVPVKNINKKTVLIVVEIFNKIVM